MFNPIYKILQQAGLIQQIHVRLYRTLKFTYYLTAIPLDLESEEATHTARELRRI